MSYPPKFEDIEAWQLACVVALNNGNYHIIKLLIKTKGVKRVLFRRGCDSLRAEI